MMIKNHIFFLLVFRAHRTNDFTKKIEKVGPNECDESHITIRKIKINVKQCFSFLSSFWGVVTNSCFFDVFLKVGR